MKLYFVSNNQHKIDEVVEYLSQSIEIAGFQKKLEELQSDSLEIIVRHKALDAYKKIHRPLIVEHTGLYISGLGDLPGGFTQLFWDKLQADKFCEYFYERGTVTAVSMIGFCDGKQIKIYKGSVTGDIVKAPRGNRSFQWDCVFQPNGSNLTFAEMGDIKKQHSMRIEALKKLKDDLGADYHVRRD